MPGADAKFTRERENANDADDTTYANVTVMETQRTAASPHQAGSKVTPERVAVVVLSLLLAAALIDRGFNYYRHIQTNESLQNELQALKRNLTDYKNSQTMESFQKMRNELQALKRNLTGESCLKCAPGWEHHGGKCYYFSAAKSAFMWNRDMCRREGAALVKIDSREEQEFLEQRVREKMKNAEDQFWIGLTDSVKEGTWLWTDGSPLDTSLSFWKQGQPNNYRGENPVDGEDCGMMGEKASAQVLMCWHDESCNKPHRYICEEAEGTGRPQCVFGSS